MTTFSSNWNSISDVGVLLLGKHRIPHIWAAVATWRQKTYEHLFESTSHSTQLNLLLSKQAKVLAAIWAHLPGGLISIWLRIAVYFTVAGMFPLFTMQEICKVSGDTCPWCQMWIHRLAHGLHSTECLKRCCAHLFSCYSKYIMSKCQNKTENTFAVITLFSICYYFVSWFGCLMQKWCI